MSEVTKDQMLMRADDIEDILNDVFARNMPELQEEDMEVDETIYHPSAEPKPFVKPRTIEEVNKLQEEEKRAKRVVRDIMLTRKVKPKGETK